MIMLYYRNSFNYQINLKIVRRLRALLFTSEAGIRLASRIFGESIEELQHHAEMSREDLRSYLDMQNVLNRNTDGADNPLSQVFSRNSAKQMFRQFGSVRTKVMFWNPRWLPGIGNLLPEWAENVLAARWGWHLWIYAQKERPAVRQELAEQGAWAKPQPSYEPVPMS